MILMRSDIVDKEQCVYFQTPEKEFLVVEGHWVVLKMSYESALYGEQE